MLQLMTLAALMIGQPADVMPWPGDRNRDGQINVADYRGVSLLDYADYQVRHNRPAVGEVTISTGWPPTVEIKQLSGDRVILLKLNDPMEIVIKPNQPGEAMQDEGLEINLIERGAPAVEVSPDAPD